MSDDNREIEEVLITPLEKVLLHIGRGIAQSQVEMDKNSYATQVMIESDTVLSEMGLVAPWYHYPEIKVDLKLELSVLSLPDEGTKELAMKKYRIFAAPMNASYCNTFNRSVQGSSSIQLRIVPIPPPTRVEPTGEL